MTTSGRSTPASSVRIVWWGENLWSFLKRIKSTGIRVMHLQRVDCRLRKWEKKKYCYIFWLLLGAKWQETLDREQSLSSLFTSFSVYLESCRSDISAFFSVNFSSDCPCCQTLDELFFSSHISTTISTVRVLTQGNALTSACSYCVRQHVTPSVINAVVMKKDVLKVFISFFVLDPYLSPVLSAPTFCAPLLCGDAHMMN